MAHCFWTLCSIFLSQKKLIMSKKKNKKVQDFDKLYWFLRYYVDFILKSSYKRITYTGTENIPTDGAIIYAPNHTNALMDALVILAMDRKPKVFVARADIFKNPKIAKILTFLKIMPIMRQRDGFNEVKKNYETINKSVDVLKDKIPFCIFPEGTHLAKYSSLPLSKGIFRIAFQAQELMPEMPLYIVPTGLRYGDFFNFRSTVRVQIGEPINVKEFIAEHSDITPQEQMNIMKDLLAERIHSTTFYIPDDQDYDAVYELCNLAQPFEIEELLKDKTNKNKKSLDLQFVANNNTQKRISTLKESSPDKANTLFKLANEASQLRKAKNISIDSISIKNPTKYCIIKILLLLITLPYTAFTSILSTPLMLVNKLILTKIKDPAFKNSVRCVIFLLLWPLLMIIYAIVLLSLLPWQWAFAIILLILPFPIISYDLLNTIKLTFSNLKLIRENKLNKIYTQIKEILFQK